MDSFTQSIFEESLYVVSEKTWVILNKPWKETQTEERVLLQKILGAVGLSVEAVTIQYQVRFNLAEWPSRPPKALYFGDSVKGLPQNEIITLDGTSVILSLPLSDLQGDAAGKQKLWQGLKLLFKP